MRVLILDTNYPAFMSDFWAAHRGLADQSYDAVWRVLMDQCFGTADYYSHNLAKIGVEAQEVIANNHALQHLWASENGVELPPETSTFRLGRRRKIVPWLRRERSQNWVYAILDAQIEAFSPDVLYVQDINFTDRQWLEQVKARGILIAGQVAYPLAHEDYSVYNVIFTSLPGYLEILGQRGARARYFRIGFEPRVLDRLGADTTAKPAYAVGFGGGISDAHSARTQFLETVAHHVPLDVWGYGVESTAAQSPLRQRHHGQAWGLEMYRALRSCGISLNGHIDIAGSYANNMRLYEATGVGSLLLTDARRNLDELFDVGNEVLAYDNVDDCLEKIKFLMNNENRRAEIARAGQARTLREHSYVRRMEELATMLQEELGGQS